MTIILQSSDIPIPVPPADTATFRLFASMIPLISPEVPSCPDPMIEKALLDITRTFCQKAQAHIEELEAVIMVDGQAEYPMVSPAGYEVFAVNRAWINSTPLAPMVRRPVNAASGNQPRYFLHPTPQRIGLYPVPNVAAAGGELQIEAVLCPTLLSPWGDSRVLNDYEGVIVSGVLGKLFSMSKKAWTDLPLSDFHMRRFRTGTSEALINALRGNTSYRHRVYPEII
jgi:hypothetical protein